MEFLKSKRIVLLLFSLLLVFFLSSMVSAQSIYGTYFFKRSDLDVHNSIELRVASSTLGCWDESEYLRYYYSGTQFVVWGDGYGDAPVGGFTHYVHQASGGTVTAVGASNRYGLLKLIFSSPTTTEMDAALRFECVKRICYWGACYNTVVWNRYYRFVYDAEFFIPPSVRTDFIDGDRGYTSIDMWGELTSLGSSSSVDVGFIWRRSQQSWSNFDRVATRSSTGYFNKELTNLQPNTYYQFKAVARVGNTNYESSAQTVLTRSITPPSISNPGASDVGETSAVLRGTIGDRGTLHPYRVEFLFRRQGQSESTILVSSSTSGTGTFTSTRTGLSRDTTYCYSFRVTTSYSTYNTASSCFTTRSGPVNPSVETRAASNREFTSATLNGRLTSVGSHTPISLSFRYGRSGTPESTWSTVVVSGNYNAPATVSRTVAGLDHCAAYQYDIRATNSLGTFVNTATRKEFLTRCRDLPSVNTYDVSAPDTSSARLRARLTSLGEYSSADIYVWYRPRFGGHDFEKVLVVSDYETLNKDIVYDLEGLNSNTQYEFMFVAVVSGGYESFSLVRYFTTDSPIPPSLTTLHVEEKGTNFASVRGRIDSMGNFVNEADVYFDFRVAGSGSTFRTVSVGKYSSAPVEFSGTLMSLLSNTVYEYRVRVSDGYQNFLASSNNFTTLEILETEIETKPVPSGNVFVTSAIVSGEVTQMGPFSVDTWFRWREQGSGGSWSTKKVNTARQSVGIFSTTISGLNQNTEYEIQAYGETGVYLYEGDLKFFTTGVAAEISAVGAEDVSFDGFMGLCGLDFLEEDFVFDLFVEYKKTSASIWEEKGTFRTVVKFPDQNVVYGVIVDGLDHSSSYVYRCKLVDKGGEEYFSDQVSFNTLELIVDPVILETLEVNFNEIGHYSAMIRGGLISLGDFSGVSVYFDVKKSSVNSWSHSKLAQSDVNSPGEFGEFFDGLDSNTPYDARIRVVAGSEQFIGNSVSFVTKSVTGCGDPGAINYNPDLDVRDDSLCEYVPIEPVFGCTDSDADNYYSEATHDDGSCEYWGCLDQDAINYDASKNVHVPSMCVFAGSPNAVNVTLSPEYAITNTSFRCSWEYVDDSGHPEANTVVEWLVGESVVFFEEFAGSSDVYEYTIDSDFFSKKEVVMCVVTPASEYAVGSPVQSNLVFINNSLPEFEGAFISPSNPFKSEQLFCNAINASDLDNDNLVVHARFYNASNELIVNWSTSNVLNCEFYDGCRRGENVYCEARVWDGDDYSLMTHFSENVTILNSPPEVRNVYIEPVSVASTFDDLFCNYTFFDVDGDEEVSANFSWYRGGVLMPFDSQILSSSETSSEETWRCEVSVFDGYDWSSARNSSAVFIDADSPRIIRTIGPEGIIMGEVYSVDWEWFSPYMGLDRLVIDSFEEDFGDWVGEGPEGLEPMLTNEWVTQGNLSVLIGGVTDEGNGSISRVVNSDKIIFDLFVLGEGAGSFLVYENETVIFEQEVQAEDVELLGVELNITPGSLITMKSAPETIWSVISMVDYIRYSDVLLDTGDRGFMHYLCESDNITWQGCAENETLCSFSSNSAMTGCTVLFNESFTSPFYLQIWDWGNRSSLIEPVYWSEKLVFPDVVVSLSVEAFSNYNKFVCEVSGLPVGLDITPFYSFYDFKKDLILTESATNTYFGSSYDMGGAGIRDEPITCAVRLRLDSGEFSDFISTGEHLHVSKVGNRGSPLYNTFLTIYSEIEHNASNVSSVSLSLRNPLKRVFGNLDMSFDESRDEWVFDFAPNMVGRWDIFSVLVIEDFNSYLFRGAPGVHGFFVLRPDDGGGGGGGGAIEIIEVIELPSSGNVTGYCGDGICQEWEDPFNCWQDCKINIDTLFTCIWDDDVECNWSQSWFAAGLFIFLIGIILVSVVYYELRRKS